ncbi:MAG: hypothetical protein IJ433_07860 [Ruminococcus sp.]|nr:hypothetical protein [Ruminococcus sp.]
MKKLFSAILASMMLATVLCGCSVKTTVETKYTDDFADSYASKKEVDKDGNVKYEYEKDEYEQFAADYYEEVKEESRLEIESSGQYSYYSPDITEIVVGINPESYEELGEEVLKAEAQKVGESALKYQMNLKNPKGELTVTYRNANTAEEYFTITVKA